MQNKRKKTKTDSAKGSKKISKKTTSPKNILPAEPRATPIPTATIQSSNSLESKTITTVDQQKFLAKLNEWLSYGRAASTEVTRKRNLDSMNDYITLEQTVTEFLDTFLLIGYNLQGQRVIVQHCTNNRDQDALIELIRNIAVIPLNRPQQDEDTF